MLFRRSIALRHVIESSQVRNCASPRNVDSFRYAVTKASCATSSASAALPTPARAARKTARRLRSTSSPNASTSPACASRTRSRSVTDASVAVTQSLDSATGRPVGLNDYPGRMPLMLNHEQLLKLIREKLDHPATPRELLQRLKLPRQQRATFKKLVGDLVESGALVQTRGNRYGLPDRMNLVVGKVVTHPRGFGFVVPDRPLEGVKGDLYIAGSNLNQAMHGDRVVARLERYTDQGAEGRILRI